MQSRCPDLTLAGVASESTGLLPKIGKSQRFCLLAVCKFIRAISIGCAGDVFSECLGRVRMENSNRMMDAQRVGGFSAYTHPINICRL